MAKILFVVLHLTLEILIKGVQLLLGHPLYFRHIFSKLLDEAPKKKSGNSKCFYCHLLLPLLLGILQIDYLSTFLELPSGCINDIKCLLKHNQLIFSSQNIFTHSLPDKNGIQCIVTSMGQLTRFLQAVFWPPYCVQGLFRLIIIKQFSQLFCDMRNSDFFCMKTKNCRYVSHGFYDYS